MNNIIKISVVVTLALVVALFAGCGKKKTEEPKNESSILTGGDIAEIFGEDNEETSDIGKVELDPDADEDTIDVGALDELDGSSSSNNSSKDSSSKDSSSKDSSSKNSSSKNQSSSSSSKNESSSKNQSSSSKNESSSKNQSSSSKEQSSSQTSSNSMSSEMEKDNDSKVYTPGWI